MASPTWRPSEMSDTELDEFVNSATQDDAPPTPEQDPLLAAALAVLAHPAATERDVLAAVAALARYADERPPDFAASLLDVVRLPDKLLHRISPTSPPPLVSAALSCIGAISDTNPSLRPQMCNPRSPSMTLVTHLTNLRILDPQVTATFLAVLCSLLDAHIPSIAKGEQPRPSATAEILFETPSVFLLLLESIHTQVAEPSKLPLPDIVYMASLALAPLLASNDIPPSSADTAVNLVVRLLNVVSPRGAVSDEWAKALNAVIHAASCLPPNLWTPPLGRALVGVLAWYKATIAETEPAWRATRMLLAIWRHEEEEQLDYTADEMKQRAEAIVQALRHQYKTQRDPNFIRALAELLQESCVGFERIQHQFVRAGAVGTLAHVLRESNDSAVKVGTPEALASEALILALSCVTYNNRSAKLELLVATTQIQRKEIIGAVLHVLQKAIHGVDLGLLALSGACLWSLVHQSIAMQQATSEPAQLEILMLALKLADEKNDPAGIQSILAVLGEALCFCRKAAMFVADKWQGLECFLYLLDKYAEWPGIAEHACYAVTSLTRAADIVALAIEKDLHVSIMNSLKLVATPTLEKEDTGYYLRVFQAISLLSFENLNVAKTSAQMGIIDYAGSALLLLPSDDVCVASLELLNNVIYKSESRKLDVEANRTIELVVELMRSRPDSTRITPSCLLLLGTAANDCMVVQGTIDEAQGLSQILSVLEANPEDSSVQMRGCASVCLLSRRNPTFRIVFGELGAVDAVIAALNNFKLVEDVQSQACWALYGLALCNDGNQEEIVDKSGLDLLLNAMQTHPSSADVQEAGCSALVALCLTNEGVTTRVGKLGGRLIILRAVCHSQQRKNTMKCGKILLGMLPQSAPRPPTSVNAAATSKKSAWSTMKTRLTMMSMSSWTDHLSPKP